MPEEIYILTGEIHSGKTTTLLQWSEKRDDVYGILTPVINGKRFFMDANTKESFDMEAGSDDGNAIVVGKYRFSKTSFRKASQSLRNGTQKKGWLIVDEAGPLELRDEGFSKVIREIIESSNTELKILLVVRNSILQKVIDHFHLDRRDLRIIDTSSGIFLG